MAVSDRSQFELYVQWKGSGCPPVGYDVRKASNRLRITVQLLEVETGAHLWADKYDGALVDVFDLQDQITDRVVGRGD
jgi:hypothetical protein